MDFERMYLVKKEDIFGSNIQWKARHMLKNLHKHKQIPVDSDRARAWFTTQACYAIWWIHFEQNDRKSTNRLTYLKLPLRRPRKYNDCSMSLRWIRQKQLEWVMKIDSESKSDFDRRKEVTNLLRCAWILIVWKVRNEVKSESRISVVDRRISWLMRFVVWIGSLGLVQMRITWSSSSETETSMGRLVSYSSKFGVAQHSCPYDIWGASIVSCVLYFTILL